VRPIEGLLPSAQKLQESLDVIAELLARVGLKINAGKMKVLMSVGGITYPLPVLCMIVEPFFLAISCRRVLDFRGTDFCTPAVIIH
jgi:hypothetical protein